MVVRNSCIRPFCNRVVIKKGEVERDEAEERTEIRSLFGWLTRSALAPSGPVAPSPW